MTNYQIIIHKFEHKTILEKHISKFLPRKNLNMATYIQHIYIRYITIVNKSQQDQYNKIPARIRPTLSSL